MPIDLYASMLISTENHRQLTGAIHWRYSNITGVKQTHKQNINMNCTLGKGTLLIQARITYVTLLQAKGLVVSPVKSLRDLSSHSSTFLDNNLGQIIDFESNATSEWINQMFWPIGRRVTFECSIC